jgi:ATP-dependent DNA ligase
LFRKQYKGKDLSKVPESKLLRNDWYVGPKYDGQYVQIHKNGDVIRFFTSGGKEYLIEELVEDLIQVDGDFIIEAEFNDKGSTGLVLNDRTKSSTSSYVSRYSKGYISSAPNCMIKIFDVLSINSIDMSNMNWDDRHTQLQVLFAETFMKRVKIVNFNPVTLSQAIIYGKALMANGGEGAFAFHKSHTIEDKGRSNLAIKIKADNKVRMTCVGAQESDTVKGEWGAFLMEDEHGHIQPFGGLKQSMREMYPYIPETQTYWVRYEQKTNGRYIQGFIYEPNS